MSKKILLADDSLTIQKVVELTLAGTDYELTCVSNGQKALESLQHSLPDLILADVVMPGKNGYEVSEAVKSNPATARIPLVLLSGTFEPFDRDRADRVGADRIVSKPFDAQHLLREIEAMLAAAASASSPPAVAAAETAGPLVEDNVSSAIHHEPFDSEKTIEIPSFLPPEEGQDQVSVTSGPELTGEEEFSGGPVFLPEPDTTTAAAEAPEARHPVEETPTEAPPAESPAEQGRLEEVSEAAETPAEVPVPPPPPAAPPTPAVGEFTEEQIERIAALVVAKLSDRVLREIAREVVPEVAEAVVKRRIEELESGVD